MNSVDNELLQELAALAPKLPTGRLEFDHKDPFDVDAWLTKHGLDVASAGAWADGRRLILKTCPWNPEHTDRSAFIVQFPNGALAAGCHHDSCEGKGWPDLRDQVEPGWRKLDHDQRSSNGGEHSCPSINVTDGDLKELTDQVWAAINRANNPPWLFRQGNTIVRVNRDTDRQYYLDLVTDNRMRHHLARVARFYKTKNDRTTPTYPPMPVTKDVLATPNPPLPPITRITRLPVYSASGQLQTTPGYCQAARIYLDPPHGFKLRDISENPSEAELRDAKRLILEELLVDFPFVTGSDRAHTFALIVEPFCREMIDGCTPLFLIEKPSPGTGASLLADICTYISAGRSISAMTEGRDEDEWRKRLTAKLLQGPSVILIDNLRRKLDCAALSSAITAAFWEDRILGRSETARIPVLVTWIATGNNPALSNEISRRTVRIRIDAKQDQPWLRGGFRHPNLRHWVKEQHPNLVWGCLTIIQSWIASGRPKPQNGVVLGQFESWSETIGGVLEAAGIPGFLGNLDELYEASDADGAAYRDFVNAWWEEHQDSEVGVSELWPLIEEGEIPMELGSGAERSQKTRLGKLLVSIRDRQFGPYRVVKAGESSGANRWRLERQ